MEIQIKIGREETGTNTITVPPTCKMAGRHHAKLLWKDGIVIIEDNESVNGTFVNGKRIAKTKVGENDTVWLGGVGGPECYQVDMKNTFDRFRETEKKARTDYSKEFEDIKNAYMEYQAEVAELKKKATTDTQRPKLLASLVPAIIGLIVFLAFMNEPKMMNLRLVVMLSGSAISGIVGMLTMNKSSSVNEKMNEKIIELQIKYQKRYCCPKCGMEYPFTTHWKKIEDKGKCLNPKCDAKFVKELNQNE